MPAKIAILTDKAFKLIEQNKEVQQFAYSLKMEETTKWYNTKISIFKNSKDEFAGIISVVRDITDKKIAEQSLKESEAKLRVSNETKDKFFSIIAHDLKSPFSAILGFSNILVENYKKYDDKKREIWKIY